MPKTGTKVKWISTEVLYILSFGRHLDFFFTIAMFCLTTQHINIMNYLILDLP